MNSIIIKLMSGVELNEIEEDLRNEGYSNVEIRSLGNSAQLRTQRIVAELKRIKKLENRRS